MYTPKVPPSMEIFGFIRVQLHGIDNDPTLHDFEIAFAHLTTSGPRRYCVSITKQPTNFRRFTSFVAWLTLSLFWKIFAGLS